MSDKPKQPKAESTENAKPNVPRTWGMSAMEFLFSLRDKQITIITTDSREYTGVLRGVATYDLVVEIGGQVCLISKHSVKKLQESRK